VNPILHRLLLKAKAQPMVAFGLVVFILAMSYLLFLFADTQGLRRLGSEAKVVAHRYRPVGQGTYTTKVGSTYRTHHRTIPEAYLITVEGDGLKGTAEVPRPEYELIKDGDPVYVTFTRKRFTRSVIIHTVQRP
jgi:hypothetical protein